MSFRPLYKIRSWMPNIKYLNYEDLLNNPRCINEVEKNDMVCESDLSGHPDAIHLLEKSPEKIDFIELSRNPSAVHLFEKTYLNDEYVVTQHMCELNNFQDIKDLGRNLSLYNIFQNPQAIHFIEKYYGYMFQYDHKCLTKEEFYMKQWLINALCINENAIHLLERVPLSSIDVESLTKNPNGYKLFEKYQFLRHKVLKSYTLYSSLCSYNEESIKFLEKYGIDIVNEPCSWLSLHYNNSDYALDILEKHSSKINWWALCLNENPRAIKMLQSARQFINWTVLFNNPAAIDMIEDYVKDKNVITSFNKIQMSNITRNPEIFVLDTDAMKQQINQPTQDGISFVEELMMKHYHPKRLQFYLEKYNYDILDDVYIDDQDDLP